MHGKTVGKICECHGGYANENCTKMCPGGAETPCTGHGKCDDGRQGDGVCSCDPGWATVECSIPCQGGSLNPCNGNGICSIEDGSCTCHAAPLKGYWTGVQCDECDLGWFGEFCNQTCPSDMPFPDLCTLHGECDPLRIECVCTKNITHGYWDNPRCSACEAGWWGKLCTNECPGTVNAGMFSSPTEWSALG
eukprot:gene17926-biopygen25976